jgi:CTP:phosphocholine cytidylyltransferase-like protein
MKKSYLIEFNVPIRQKCTLQEALDQIDYVKVFQKRKSEEWLLARLQSGEIEAIRIGNRWHVFIDSLEQYILKINNGE